MALSLLNSLIQYINSAHVVIAFESQVSRVLNDYVDYGFDLSLLKRGRISMEVQFLHLFHIVLSLFEVDKGNQRFHIVGCYLVLDRFIDLPGLLNLCLFLFKHRILQHNIDSFLFFAVFEPVFELGSHQLRVFQVPFNELDIVYPELCVFIQGYKRPFKQQFGSLKHVLGYFEVDVVHPRLFLVLSTAPLLPNAHDLVLELQALGHSQLCLLRHRFHPLHELEFVALTFLKHQFHYKHKG